MCYAGFPEQLRYTLRKLRRAPGYVALSVGLLALALGIVAATYTVLNQAVLRPLPVADQGRLVVAWADHTVRGADHYPITSELFEVIERSEGPVFSDVAAVGSYGTGQRAVEIGTDLMPLAWARVLGDFFGTLGVEPALGRALEVADDVPNPSERVAVISHGLWIRGFGGSRDVLGRVLHTLRGSFTVIGVMPPDFDYPRGAEVWAPTRPEYPEWDSELPRLELDVLARLLPGVTVRAVQGELSILSRSTPDLERTYEGTVPVVRPFEEHVLGDLGQTLLILVLGGLLVLVVASLDLANVVLVRALGEQRELAVRRALGMHPRWVYSGAVIEAAAIGLAAAALGVVLGSIAIRLLIPLAPAELPRLALIRGLDASAVVLVLFGALVAVVAAVVLPRWSLGRKRSVQGLARSGSAMPSRGLTLLRDAVAVGQVAVAVWVLVTGALLVRTVLNLQNLDAGFDPDGLTVVALSHLEGGLLSEPGEDRELAAAIARIERNGFVVGATPIQMPPLPGAGAWQTILFRDGQTRVQALEENAYVFMEFVEPDFASILDVPVLRGRVFDESDRPEAAHVLVVNRTAARLYWPGEDAVGKQIRVGFSGYEDTPFSVIGVVGDTRYGDLTELKPMAYFPVRQMGIFRVAHIMVRTTGPNPPVLEVVRDALRSEAPQYRALGVNQVSDRLDEPLARPRFAAVLLSVLALTALLISVVGVYSVMAYVVRTSRHELGVRMACGGTPGDVAGLIVRRGMSIAVVGSGLGVAIAAMSGGAVRSLLFGVAPVDPRSVASGVVIVLLSAALACLLPAFRAATTDPAVVLSAE